MIPYSAAPGRARSEPKSSPRKMPEELAKLRAAGGKAAQAAAKRSRWCRFSGSSAASAETRWVMM